MIRMKFHLASEKVQFVPAESEASHCFLCNVQFTDGVLFVLVWSDAYEEKFPDESDVSIHVSQDMQSVKVKEQEQLISGL